MTNPEKLAVIALLVFKLSRREDDKNLFFVITLNYKTVKFGGEYYKTINDGMQIFKEAMSYLYFLKCKTVPLNKIFHPHRQCFYIFILLNKVLYLQSIISV